MRSIACRSSASVVKRAVVASSRPPRSTHAGAVPQTRISSTSGSASSGSSGPSPNDRSAIRSASASRAMLVEHPRLAVDERADARPRVVIPAGLGRLREHALAQRPGEPVQGGLVGGGVHHGRATPRANG